MCYCNYLQVRINLPSQEKEKPVQPCIPIVIGSPIGTPLTSRKTQKNRNNFPLRTKSADAGRPKPIEEVPRPQSAYITEYFPPPIKVDMAIQSEGHEQNELQTPPGTPEVPAGATVAEEARQDDRVPPVEAANNQKQDSAPPPAAESELQPTSPAQRQEPVQAEADKKKEKRIR